MPEQFSPLQRDYVPVPDLPGVSRYKLLEDGQRLDHRCHDDRGIDHYVGGHTIRLDVGHHFRFIEIFGQVNIGLNIGHTCSWSRRFSLDLSLECPAHFPYSSGPCRPYCSRPSHLAALLTEIYRVIESPTLASLRMLMLAPGLAMSLGLA